MATRTTKKTVAAAAASTEKKEQPKATAVKAEPKAAVTKAAPAKTEAPAKTAEKAVAAPKKTTTRKTTAKKAAPKQNTEVYIQFWGKEVYAKDVVTRIKEVWTNEMGRKESELVDLKVYIKPEENAAHYVINGDTFGCISL